MAVPRNRGHLHAASEYDKARHQHRSVCRSPPQPQAQCPLEGRIRSLPIGRYGVSFTKGQGLGLVAYADSDCATTDDRRSVSGDGFGWGRDKCGLL